MQDVGWTVGRRRVLGGVARGCALTVCMVAMRLLVAGGQQPDTSKMMATRTIVDNAAHASQYSTLVSAVKAAGLAELLNGPGPFTVFAASNDAYSRLPAGTLDSLLAPANGPTLKSVLLYQVVPGKVSSADLKAEVKKHGGLYELATLEGDKLAVTLAGGNVVLTDEGGRSATITTADVPQANGLVHCVDSVLLPARTLTAEEELLRQQAMLAANSQQYQMAYGDRHLWAGIDDAIRGISGGASNPPPAPSPTPPSYGGSTARPKASRPHDRKPASVENSEYQPGQELQKWKDSLKTGAIEYRVPPAMVAQQIATVTVRIHGFADANTSTLTDATGTGTAKVASYMKAELLAPLTPGEFTIAGTSEAIQFIPNDGYATWRWNVTPAFQAKQQQLEVVISLVHTLDGKNIADVLEDKTYTVNVDVQKLGTTISHEFWKNPIAWFQYMLPGGKGWGALAALVASLGGIGGILKWMNRKKQKAAATPPSAVSGSD